MKKLETTKEAVLKAAQEHPCSSEILKTLFPEAFEDNSIFCNIGSIFKRSNYPGNMYALFKWNGEVRFMNITHNKFWDDSRNLKTSGLKDYEAKTITVSEFKKLIGAQDVSQFEIVK